MESFSQNTSNQITHDHVITWSLPPLVHEGLQCIINQILWKVFPWMLATESLFFIPPNNNDDIDHNDTDNNDDDTTVIIVVMIVLIPVIISQNPGHCESDLFPFLGPTQLL